MPVRYVHFMTLRDLYHTRTRLLLTPELPTLETSGNIAQTSESLSSSSARCLYTSDNFFRFADGELGFGGAIDPSMTRTLVIFVLQ